MPRALVLGATGHIGAHVVRALLADGHAVRAAYRSERHLHVLDGLPVERVRLDLDTLEGIDPALDGCPWVIHAGAYYPRGASDTPRAVGHALDVTRRLLARLSAARPQRVVLTSSAATIRHVPGRPATEQDAETWPPSEPRSTYSTVKIAIEHEFLASGLPLVVVNPSVCVGEYDARAFSGQLILTFAKSWMPFYIDHTLNAVYTGDVGVGHVRAAAAGRLGERYLLSSRTITVREISGMIARAAGRRAPRWKIPHALLRAAAPLLGVPRHAVQSLRAGQFLDGSKAVRELGLPQTPIEDAVERAVRWFRAQGRL